MYARTYVMHANACEITNLKQSRRGAKNNAHTSNEYNTCGAANKTVGNSS